MVNKIDTKTLNEKLAVWVGFKIPINRFTNKPFPHNKHSANLWETPEGMITTELPDLVGSLDAQVKWIYPKLVNLRYIFFIGNPVNFHNNQYNVEILSEDYELEYKTSDNNPAMAFALAVEKLIDSLEKK